MLLLRGHGVSHGVRLQADGHRVQSDDDAQAFNLSLLMNSLSFMIISNNL